MDIKDIKLGDNVFSRKHLREWGATPMMAVGIIGGRLGRGKVFCGFSSPNEPMSGSWFDVEDLAKGLEDGEEFHGPMNPDNITPHGMVFYDRERAEKAKKRDEADPDLYTVLMAPPEVGNIDPVHDAQDAITCLVSQFVRRNRYEDNISALQDVTPNQWKKQVSAAAQRLENELTDLMESYEAALHDGQFFDRREVDPKKG